QDLGALVEVLRDHADEVSPKLMSRVGQADDAAESINAAIIDRGEQTSSVSVASDERQRAFTLLLRAYDNARRAVSFLRWHEGDADTLVPSLYTGRGSRNSKPDEEPTEPAPSVAAPSTPPPPSAIVEPAATPGMPGTSPFINS